MIPREVVTFVAVVALASTLVFAVRYHLSSAGTWRTSRVGRNAMYVTLALAALVLLNVLSRVLGGGLVQQLGALAVYGTVAFLFVQRSILQARAQRGDHESRGRREDDTNGPHVD